MKYEKFDAENFLADQKFVEWVLNPNSQNTVYWQSIVKNYPQKENEIKVAVKVLKSLNAHAIDSELEEDSKHIWKKIQPMLANAASDDATRRLKLGRSRFYSLWMKVAASILIMIGLSWWMYPIINQAGEAVEEIAMITKSNPKGKKTKITLRDGSVVWLNSESRIQYTEDFGRSVRAISLEGEAFFEVAKNPDIPFVVRTKNITTTALGTSFNISNYPENENILVSLATGKIVVKGDEKPESNYLEPGDHISYSREDDSFKEWHDASAATYLWKDGIIQFNKANIDEVIGYLERWYGVEFEIEGSIPIDFVYTGTFDNESLEKVLIGLAFSLHFDHEIENKHIKIKFSENQ
ncbi:MAG: FecR domain-containing protein [Reichenbachiella sp.]|uniref:FecR family protein n=1 Tax=Reichenbachiella sp. TaxID=2184521 RepID=UPI0032646585